MSGARYISSRVVKMLYAHSGNECANPSCHAKLVYVEDNAKDEQICHIEAASSKGPRYNPNQTEEERNGYDNLILLCHKCHDMIDHNPGKYTVELLKQWKKEHEDKYINTQKAKVFRTSIPDGLLPRNNEVDKLFDGISNNRIYNLIGVGGSGKSSLAYLMIQKYKDYFNEIAFVVVNSDIKQDIVTQLNRTLKFELKKDLYSEIISYLQENFKSEQPNLLVLDINETASKTDIFIDEILKDSLFLEGWKFLILSRENVDTRKRISSHSLYDKNDFDFLKKLFLEKAGERYNDFGDFETLFKVIFYNPLLAEQLGIYLSNEPQTATIDDIKTILYGSTFREEDVQGMSAQRHDETIISFLKNLIVYDKMDIKERTLLRHFVLWRSDYICYDVIADLLNGVFESESILKKVLKKLVNRSIIVTQVNEDKVLCYKLHGLLAYSLREQIDFKEEDWKAYWDNIKRIIEYDFSKFMPYFNCIGNSLCDVLNIITDEALAFDVFIKFFNGFIFYFDQKSQKEDNPYVQFMLGMVTFLIAYLQYIQGDVKSAELTHKKAILIGEQLPKDNPEFQDFLAKAYRLLANLQRERDYESAESNYEKAISIGEQLPKDNYEYQNDLARTYNELAYLQNFNLEDYKSSETNYEKAISIGEQLPKDNPKYQNDLARTYNNLANLQYFTLEDYKSSETNYEKSISIGEQLPKDNPKYQDVLANNNLAVSQMKLKKITDAESNICSAINIYKQLEDSSPNCLIYRLNSEGGLAEIYLSSGKAEKAKEILNRIQPLAKKCLAENPNDNFTIEVNKGIEKLLEECSQKLNQEN